MINSANYFCILLFILFSLSCSDKENKIIIKGHLENLPDGKMALYTMSKKTGKIEPIDTVKTRKGSFLFSIDRKIYPEPINVYLNHIQYGTNTKRIFCYLTNLKYKGARLDETGFMLEDSIQLNGVLKPFTYPASSHFKLQANIIPNDIDRPIVLGKQTRVFYTDTLGFARLSDVEQIKKLVRQHPYSYYYLYAIERRVAEFSNEAFMSIFTCFDKDVQESATGQNMLSYVNQRETKHLDFTTSLLNEQGQSLAILDKNARYNLVVLWASWCGPCRLEIPSLKKLHARLGVSQQLHLVSVSLDQDRAAWVQAMKKEQMPWRQLLITPSAQTYAKEIFQFDGSIPTMLLVNQRGEVVKKVVGYNEKNLDAIEAIVTSR